MDNKAYVSSTAFVVVFLLYLRFGTLAFWVIAVTGFLSAIFASIIETFLHIILKEDSFQNYRKLKRKVFKGAFFDIDNTEICQKHRISEVNLLVIMVLFFIGIISLIYAII
jgi:hypothetical protein